MSEEQPPAGVERFGSDDDVPRLPDRPPPEYVRRGQLTFDLAAASMPVVELVRKQPDWSEYEEPQLLPRLATRRVFLATRGLATAWAIAIVVAAVVTRSNAQNGIDDGGLVRLLGWVGIGVVVVVAVAGWWWSDRVTRNVHQLEARLPSRARCVSAWAAPLIWTGLLAVTVLQIEPSDIFDVRPSIVVPIFLAAMWRPPALVRRVLSSLIRIGSDALVGAVFVLDVGGFGLLWWRLSTWPSSLDPSNVSTVEVMIGLAAVAAISLAGSTAAWAVLLLDVDRAEHHRRVAVRTRFDHRQLRLRGIDPLDPEVRWAMLRLRREEEQARAAELEGADAEQESSTEPVEEEDFEFEAAVWLEEAGVLRRRPAWSPVADEEASSSTVEADGDAPSSFEFDLDGAIRAAGAPGIDVPAVQGRTLDVGIDEPPVEPVVEEVDAESGVVESGVVEPAVEEMVEEVDAEVDQESGVVESGVLGVDEPVVEEVDAESGVDEPVVEEAEPVAEAPEDAPVEPVHREAVTRAARLAARLEGRIVAEPDSVEADEPAAAATDTTADVAATVDVVGAVAESLASTGADAEPTLPKDSLAERLASRMADAPESTEVDRLDRLAGRLSSTGSDEPSAAKSLLSRLEALGITPETHSYEAESLIRPADRTRESSEPEPELVNPRAYGLELVRYLLLLAMAATAVTAAWMLTRSVDAGDQLVGGAIDENDVDRIDLARRFMILALGVMLALVPLWATLVSVHARRAGVPDTHHRRCLALFGVAVAANVAAFVLDGDTRSTVSLLCVLGCLAIVPLSIVTVVSIVRWIDLRSAALMVWSLGLAIMVATLWIGGLNRPIEATDALEVLSFFSGLLAVTAGVVVVVAVMNTETIEDTLRLLPAAEDEPPAPGDRDSTREVVTAE